MAALTRSKSGAYTARKGIPKDVQEEYERLYGVRWEAKLTLPASLRPQEAKARYGAWLEEIEQRIDAIRAQQRGERQSLSQKQAAALAGEWYRDFTARYEENPGSPERWDADFWVLIDRLMDHAPVHIIAHDRKYLDQIVRDPEILKGIRPAMAKEARADQFLASKGLALTPEAYDLFIDCIVEAYLAAVLLLKRRARRDFTPDGRLEQFPKFEVAPKPHKAPQGLTPWKLFKAWVEAREPGRATVDRWRAVFLDLENHFKGRTAASITPDEAQAWAEGSITTERSATTVKDIWVNAARTVFGWAADTKRLTTNPFKGVKIATKRKVQIREREFRPDEIKRILNAASATTDTERPSNAARRWVPWLCAYTGARAGEITQLRVEDVIKGHWAIQISPDAGTVKTNKSRIVPLHEHLIEQGFIEFARTKGNGPLFYRADGPSKAKTNDLQILPRHAR